MTNLERYHKILKTNLGAEEADFNDEVMRYNNYKKWESVRHMDIIADLEEAFDISFGVLDITSFDTYSKGIQILEKLGVDMKA